jgi:hypothetical protein
MKKEITLEILAQKIDSGFIRMEEKFDGIGQEFVKVYEKFNSVDGRFDTIDKSIKDRLFETNDQVFGLQDKIARVEKILKIG